MEQEKLNIKTPEYVSLQFRLAGLGSRATAHIIDHLLLFITQVLIILVLLLVTSNDLWIASESVIFSIILISIFVLQYGYFLISEYFWTGKTIGKHLLGIRVVQENGHNITFLSSFIRNCLRLVDMLPISYAIGMICVFAHSKHKRLGDMAAGTLVVHERRKKSNKKTPLEKYLIKKGIQKDALHLDSFQLKRFSQQDWKLLETYVHRLIDMNAAEKHNVTKQVSDILLPKIEDTASLKSKSNEEWLLLLYLHLKDEWDFT